MTTPEPAYREEARAAVSDRWHLHYTQHGSNLGGGAWAPHIAYCVTDECKEAWRVHLHLADLVKRGRVSK